MKKGKLVLQGTVPELIHKANGKVWELSVSPQEARQWQTKTTVANLRHEGKEIILRIISDNMPCLLYTSGVIYGTKGFAVIDNINNFEAIRVYDDSYKQVAAYMRPKPVSYTHLQSDVRLQ